MTLPFDLDQRVDFGPVVLFRRRFHHGTLLPDFNRVAGGEADSPIEIRGHVMPDNPAKVPGKIENTSPSSPQPWRPFESLRREVDRLFDDFSGGIWRSPFGRSFFDVEPFRRAQATLGAVPAVDVTQTDKGYEITAELPGMEEKDIDVKLTNGVLTIRGEKRDEKEEKKNDYYVRERSFGSFERSFQVPENVDTDKVSASFKKGVLTVMLPKSAEAQKAEKKIEVKAG
jgi:HSP20 family protein